MAEDRPITVVIVENHGVVINGVREWCARADPRSGSSRRASSWAGCGPARAPRPTWSSSTWGW